MLGGEIVGTGGEGNERVVLEVDDTSWAKNKCYDGGVQELG
jgi:hypothetical protein